MCPGFVACRSASSFIPSVTDTGDPSYSARSVIAISNDVAVRLDVSTFTQQCLQVRVVAVLATWAVPKMVVALSVVSGISS
jgi:hypothetical protein